jgi:hypothetical protein
MPGGAAQARRGTAAAQQEGLGPGGPAGQLMLRTAVQGEYDGPPPAPALGILLTAVVGPALPCC